MNVNSTPLCSPAEIHECTPTYLGMKNGMFQQEVKQLGELERATRSCRCVHGLRVSRHPLQSHLCHGVASSFVDKNLQQKWVTVRTDKDIDCLHRPYHNQDTLRWSASVWLRPSALGKQPTGIHYRPVSHRTASPSQGQGHPCRVVSCPSRYVRVREIGREVEKKIMGNMVAEAEVLQQKKQAGAAEVATEAASSPSSSEETKKRQ